MRKADYTLLASIIRAHIQKAKDFQQVALLESVAREFAAKANVTPAAFLVACGIVP
jgi:hypothetical protein